MKIKDIEKMNSKYVDVSIKNKISREEFNEIKTNFKTFQFVSISIMAVVFFLSIVFSLMIKDSVLFAAIYSLASILVVLMLMKNDESFIIYILGVVFSIPTLITVGIFYCLLQGSKHFIIFEKEIDNHIIKVNYNLQEFKYQNGQLSSESFDLAEKLKEDHVSPVGYSGNYYYKGIKGNKVIRTSKEYENFKKEVEITITKTKLVNF